MAHKCLAPSCTQRVPSSQLACRGHWYALPQAMRDAIWYSFRAGPLSHEHTDAMLEAVAYLEQRFPAAPSD